MIRDLKRQARALSLTVLALAMATQNEAAAKGSKPPPAAEYFGHFLSFAGSMFVLHIDAFTPDEAADAVARAGRDGDSDAIRTALGHLDAGFVKLGTKGYRVAYARRLQVQGGVRLVLVLRNEMDSAEYANGKVFLTPPLSALSVWLPSGAEGEAVISPAATVVFHSADDITITDWSTGTWVALGLKERRR